MRDMRDHGASYTEIAARFDLHHTTVMHHLDAIGHSKREWKWNMRPHEIVTALRMREAGASYGEIGRALRHPRQTVRRTLTSESARHDLDLWLNNNQPGPPPSAA